jgi:hypothetical protein
MESRKTKYLLFTLAKGILPGIRKTQTWEIYSVRHGILLGRIAWYGAWIQYAFFPEPGTVFNMQCLKDINAFIKDLMKERGR